MSETINAEGPNGHNYVLRVDEILYCVEINSLPPEMNCNIVMRNQAHPVTVKESYRVIQSRIETAKTEQRAAMQLIFEQLTSLYNEHIAMTNVSDIDLDALFLHVAQIHDVAAASLGYSIRLAESHEQLQPDYQMAKVEHALDVDYEQIRVLHRVIRAMHDGECMMCSANGKGKLRHPSELVPPNYPEFDRLAFRCDVCGLQITKDQVNISLQYWSGIASNNIAAWLQFWNTNKQESA
jgi:hypothetical protein